MTFERLKHVCFALAALAACIAPAHAEEAYSFNVLNHRGVAITAQYWNPILKYVSDRSGVPLELRLTRTSKENTAKAEKGAFDFLYTNHFFTPERDKLGYRVIARPAGPGIRSKIIVLADSPAKTLAELDGGTVGVPGPDGFTGYWLPMDALLRAGAHPKVVFSGSQEETFLMLARKQVAAAGANDSVLEQFAHRTPGFNYRVLWTSKVYNDLCIMVNPRVPREKVDAVKAAFVGMAKDPAGRKVLEAAAQLIKDSDETGFVPSDNRDYDDYRTFYKHTRVKPAQAG